MAREYASNAPRKQDPLVWAAAFGAAFVHDYHIAFTALDAPTFTERHALALQSANGYADQSREVADAAVLALHPEPANTIVDLPADRLAALDAAERAYLLASGWTEGPADSWLDPTQPMHVVSRSSAIGWQRHRDRA